MSRLFKHAARAVVLLLIPGLLHFGCRKSSNAKPGVVELSVLMSTDTNGVWHALFDEFHRLNPTIRINYIEGPTATNTREDLYVTSFLSGQTTYDLIYADVPWIPKFAAAGWLEDLTNRWTETEWDRFLPGILRGSTYRGKNYMVPVQMNGGVLFYRKDLLKNAAEEPPKMFADLVRISEKLQDPPERWGYVWQGKQYEGLSCDFMEVLEGFGGTWIDPATGKVGLDEPEALAALEFLRDCIRKTKISPPGTTTYDEESSRRLFHSGRAVFHRNWPYVWALSQKEDSPIHGKVGMVPMPRAPGGRHAATLGGWGFAIARSSKHKNEAWRFLEYMANYDCARQLYVSDGAQSALKEFYERSDDPMQKAIYVVLQTAAPRPPVPQYAQASDILQRYVSAALTDQMEPEAALKGAATETRLLLGRPGKHAP